MTEVDLSAVLMERLEHQDIIHAVKVTQRRREWMTKARPGDRWAVTTVEGGEFRYGRSLTDAFMKALRPVDTP